MTRIHRVLDRNRVSSLDEYVARGGGVGLENAYRLGAADVIDVVSAAGLRGRGGAGFPTGAKWTTVRESRSSSVATTVVVNAAEGEPGTFKDRAIIDVNPYRMLEGAGIAAVAVAAERIVVGVKATFDVEIARLISAIDEMVTSGCFEGVAVELVLGPSSYLFGEETGLLEVVEGRQPFPRVTPPFRRGIEGDDTRSAGGVHLAAAGGSDEPPALVDNVETMANVALILANGAEWFREIGTDSSPGSIVCTISGATRRDGVAEFPMGTTIRQVIDEIGWGVETDREIVALLSGTANPIIPPSLLDTPLTYEDMAAAGSGLGSAGFIVYDDRTDPVAIAAGVSRFLSVESCGQCEPCKRDGIALADLLGSMQRGRLSATELDDVRRRVDTVAVGARCNLARQQEAVIGSLLALFPDLVRRRLDGDAGGEVVEVVPIATMVGGRAVPDTRQLQKQPDWSYDAVDSGAWPAARLGDTPVHITEPVAGARKWPEWHSAQSGDNPLEMVDDGHVYLDSLILAARDADPSDRADAVAMLRHDVAVHIDVTQRILYPMARRYGDDDTESLADEAEAQEAELSTALAKIDPGAQELDFQSALAGLTSLMSGHVEREEAMLEILRHVLDDDAKEDLAEALAEGRATSLA